MRKVLQIAALRWTPGLGAGSARAAECDGAISADEALKGEARTG